MRLTKKPRQLRREVEADLARTRQIREELDRLKNRQPTPPRDWEKPSYASEDYWQARYLGWITEEEAHRDSLNFQIKRTRAIDSKDNHSPAPSRHARPEPCPSRQWMRSMATTAARDDRLTPQAKALLQVIRARCGRDKDTTTTKTTLADIMSRCPRSIQRYLQELARFGYIQTRTLKARITGLYTGLRIRITEKVLTYFFPDQEYREKIESQSLNSQGIPVETQLSPIKTPLKDSYVSQPKRHDGWHMLRKFSPAR